jgi:hypothetical protein
VADSNIKSEYTVSPVELFKKEFGNTFVKEKGVQLSYQILGKGIFFYE